MNHINESEILSLLNTNADEAKISAIIEKAMRLQRLSLAETAALITSNAPSTLKKILEASAFVKNAVYGRRIVIFAPLYISSVCENVCAYCAFASGNSSAARKRLSINEIKKETERLLSRGHKRILMVAGESSNQNQDVDYFAEAMEAVYSAKVGEAQIRRVNVNCAPLSAQGYKRLKEAGIGTYQIFQETYHRQTYKKVHLKGPKTDPDKRLAAIDNAINGGIDDIGIGVLFGLYDWKFEVLAMLAHIEHLEKTYGFGPHTISVPRIEPAEGSEYSRAPDYPISDEDFKKLVAILRLSVPYTGIIMSTRETSELRDELFNLGVSQISAESSVVPGGYENNKPFAGQFSVHDKRTLGETISSLVSLEHMPSFCAGCYRKNRTGEAFMSLARTGNIKNQCEINALITFKEYLEDYATPDVKTKGYALIQKHIKALNAQDKEIVEKLLKEVDEGKRDLYV